MRKTVNKAILVLFSIIILVIGVMINLLAVGWLDFETASRLMGQALTQSPTNQIILVITEFCIIFAVIGIFVDIDKKEPKGSKGVLMQNDNGKLMISKETLESLVNSVVQEYKEAMQTQTRIQLDQENNVIVLVDLTVTKDVIIKDLTLNMQNKIKEAIKKTSDLEVKQVNVRIKNIVEPEAKNQEKTSEVRKSQAKGTQAKDANIETKAIEARNTETKS